MEQLLGMNYKVRVIVRSSRKLPPEVSGNPTTTVVEAGLLDLTDEEMAEHVKNCHVVVSCLGHVPNLKGIFGKPRKLCTDATRRLCNAIEKNRPPEPTKFILMNTVGVQNPDLREKRTWFERGLLTLLRHTLPPHRDNETAAKHLHGTVGKENKHIEWCIVRPDSLIDAEVSPYDIKESPVTGLLTGRPTTRSNVAQLITELIENAELWSTWKVSDACHYELQISYLVAILGIVIPDPHHTRSVGYGQCVRVL